MNAKFKAIIVVMLLCAGLFTMVGLAAVKNGKGPVINGTVGTVKEESGPQSFVSSPAYGAIYTASNDNGNGIKAKADTNGDGKPEQDGGKVTGYAPVNVEQKVDPNGDSDPEIDDGNVADFDAPSYGPEEGSRGTGGSRAETGPADTGTAEAST